MHLRVWVSAGPIESRPFLLEKMANSVLNSSSLESSVRLHRDLIMLGCLHGLQANQVTFARVKVFVVGDLWVCGLLLFAGEIERQHSLPASRLRPGLPLGWSHGDD